MTGQTVKISSLQQRYKLNSRQAIYDRINGLKMRPVAPGKISAEQLDLLDRLDIHIRGGGAIADFPIQPEVQVDKLDKIPQRDIKLDSSGMSAVNVMAELMEKMMSYAYARDSSPLANYEELEKAAKFEWVLPTSLVKQLTGVSPKTTHDSHAFLVMGFAFTKIGKIGREAGWQVTKQVATLDLKWLSPVRQST
ncbi:hypothetical protein NIES4072_31450 [Nostoc commune NIES-4072]|uniref:Uncharacterized protein n=1 Tax=Nostoc commune NIES-4072 TaxID=2005467 RepID=A0A2R5FL16_NOSCO|nr:hypothetical protein [Nostoc commune]BBD69522.1 hypothetical protein NIES4070_59310 [Nostoc commune HK-02]GBG19477.1 hypothetical protein NIES4072_31450 [Nostoc commune NIES-4072]